MSQPARHVRLVTALSIGSAWDGLIRRCFAEAVQTMVAGGGDLYVVTPSLSVAYFLKERALDAGLSLAGVRFLIPTQLRTLLMRRLKEKGHLARPEQQRLLLAAAAEAVSEEQNDAAAAIASAPDGLLRALDNLERAGWEILEEVPRNLRPVVREYQRLVRQCELRLPGELDRALLIRAAQAPPSIRSLLIAGFDGQHWPQWPLLAGAVVSSISATILLPQVRAEAHHLDSLWVGTWEQYFGTAEPLEQPDRARPFLELFGRSSDSPATDSGNYANNVSFLVGNDPGELASAIVTRVLHDLSEENCTRLGIVFARPGPLPRLVSLRLAEAGVPHNDGIGHPLPGPFERPAWQAWRRLQEDRRIEPFVALLRQCPAILQRCGGGAVNGIEERLRKELSDLLIDDLGVLATSLADHAGTPLANAIGSCLREMVWLPERATLPELLKATEEAFAELDWPERLAELNRATAEWLDHTRRIVSRAAWLQWLDETILSTTKLREPLGRHPYARAHLLTYGQAESQEWSHVIACDLSEGEWPPREGDEGWFSERDFATMNSRLPWLNMLATAQGGQGLGHETLRAGHTWCLTSADELAIARRQFANLLENTSVTFTAAASLHSATHPERIAHPGELYNSLHFRARGQALSARTLRVLHEETARWLPASTLWTRVKPDFSGIEATRTAWNLRRDRTAPFGEYQFALRKPPAAPCMLGATAWEAALQRPALVWLKAFLGVDEPRPADVDLTPAAIGTWVHRWLATIAPADEFTFIPEPEALEKMTRAAAAAFRDAVISLFTHTSRELPDWWIATWNEAAGIAAILSRRLGAVTGWEKCAVEWNLRGVIVPLASGQTLRIRGRADLVLLRGKGEKSPVPGGEAWIIDYKTGDPEPLDPWRLANKGDGIQLALYGLAARTLGPPRVAMSRVGPSLDLQAPQLHGEDLDRLTHVWSMLASMQDRGVFGQRGPLRSEFGVSAVYPLATLAIDPELLAAKWDKTLGVFAMNLDMEDTLP